MNYSFVTVEELQALYEKEKGSFPLNMKAYWLNNDEILHVYAYVCRSDEGKTLGLCVGAVYKNGTMGRMSQWQFGENMHRELWIDHIHTDPNSECKGSYLLDAVEKKLEMHKDEVERKNIYVVSVFEAISFYEKCGYKEIFTLDHEEDEDYPSSFVDGSCIGTWMCKPLSQNIDSEKEATFLPEYCFGSAMTRNSLTILNNFLNFSAGQELLYFLDNNNFEEFKKNHGRKYLKYTEEEFRNEFYPRYSQFLTLLEDVKNMVIRDFKSLDLTNHPIVPYFKNMSLETLKESLGNYTECFM